MNARERSIVYLLIPYTGTYILAYLYRNVTLSFVWLSDARPIPIMFFHRARSRRFSFISPFKVVASCLVSFSCVSCVSCSQLERAHSEHVYDMLSRCIAIQVYDVVTQI